MLRAKPKAPTYTAAGFGLTFTTAGTLLQSTFGFGYPTGMTLLTAGLAALTASATTYAHQIWKAHRYFYVSACHRGDFALISGPYPSRRKAADDINRVRGILSGKVPSTADVSWSVVKRRTPEPARANRAVGFQPAL
jgi:hypothetical protein